jgi:hypothetical protein
MSTYSSILRTELIGAGEQPGTWGSTTNSNFQYIYDSAIAGYQTVTVTPTSNNQVLTYVNGPSASPSLNQAIYAVLKLNAGTLGANFNLFAPPVSKTFIIWNNTSYTATFYNSSVIGNTTAAGSGITVPAGAKVQIWSDGTNFFPSFDTTTGNFAVAGNLTASSNLNVTGTANITTLTASSAVATDASKNLVSVANTGTGSNVLATSPTLVTPILGTPTSGNFSTGTFTWPTFNQSTSGNAATATSSNQITNSGGWSVTPSGTTLYFNYNGVNVAKLDSSGNLTVKANVTAYGTV